MRSSILIFEQVILKKELENAKRRAEIAEEELQQLQRRQTQNAATERTATNAQRDMERMMERLQEKDKTIQVMENKYQNGEYS